VTSLYLGWGRSNAWGVALAEDLGALAVFTGESDSNAARPRSLGRRYLRDLRISREALATHAPDLVIWQVPPTIAPLVGSVVTGPAARWGIDMHSGGVNLGRWRWLLPVLRYRARKATFTVVHNDEIVELMRPWPSPVFVIKNYVVPVHERPKRRARTAIGDIIVAASGAVDEPLDVVTAAARLLGGDFSILVTGRPETLKRRLAEEPLPPNVRLTGYLPRPVYLDLLASAAMTVCLTSRPATMQLGAWEAASLGCPVVVSDQTVLRRYFTRGARLCQNSGPALADAIASVRREYETYRTAADQAAGEMETARSVEIAALRRYLWPA